MKDYIVQNQPLLDQHRYLRMIADTQTEVAEIRKEMSSYGALVMEHDDRLVEVMERLNDTVRESELSPIMLDFSREEVQRENLFLDGKPTDDCQWQKSHQLASHPKRSKFSSGELRLLRMRNSR